MFALVCCCATGSPSRAGEAGVYSCSANGGSQCAAPIPDVHLGGVVSSFVVAGCDELQDVDVGLTIDHGWTGDLKAVLLDPRGRRVLLVDRPGATGLGWGCELDDVDAMLDDEADDPVEDACADNSGGTVPAIGGSLRPAEPLAVYDGAGGNGTWSLRISDLGEGDSGVLLDWSLILTCASRQVDLVLSKTASVDQVAPGGSVTYTLEVTNLGPDVATGVVVSDLLPLELTYTSDNCGTLIDGTAPGGTLVQWRAGSLDSGVSASCEITVTIDPGATGDLENSASVAGLEADTQPANNEASALIEVGIFFDGFESGDTSAWSATSRGATP